MYKISLFDYCMPSACSGVALFFTDDIEQFQQDWFALEEDGLRKERFLQSKSGKIVTDYYSDDEELAIVQRDDSAKVLAEETVRREDIFVTLVNGYGWTGEVRIADLCVVWRYVLFKGRCHLAGSYQMKGVCSYRGDGIYDSQECYGNKVLKSSGREGVGWREGKLDRERSSFAYFKDNVIASICFIEVREYDEVPAKLAMPAFGGREYEILFRDILGDAG